MPLSLYNGAGGAFLRYNVLVVLDRFYIFTGLQGSQTNLGITFIEKVIHIFDYAPFRERQCIAEECSYCLICSTSIAHIAICASAQSVVDWVVCHIVFTATRTGEMPAALSSGKLHDYLFGT